MDLNRLRRLAGFTISESVSNDPALNAEIENRLKRVRRLGWLMRDNITETAILDALDVLHRAGEAGVSVSEWAEGVKALHPDMSMKALLSLTVKEFDCCVSRIGDKRYAFVEKRASEDGIDDVDPQTRSMVSMQVGFVYDALEAMGEKGQFTKGDLIDYLGARGMSGPQATMYADHLLTNFGAEKIGHDLYRMPQDEPTSNAKTMDFLRSIANDPSNLK